jgi:hypothetical protein
MKIFICISILSALIGTTIGFGARTEIDQHCYPKAPVCAETDLDCPTCCCESSENVEFYNPDAPEPECNAPPATYEIRFVFTWSNTCHPDYYFNDSHWTSPSAVVHNTAYRMWDACMQEVGDGVAILSQSGSLSKITTELLVEGLVNKSVLDAPIFDSQHVPQGNGSTSFYLNFDKYHQWVSALSHLAPSADQLVGVADLRMCDGDKWKEKVKACLELFSTAKAGVDAMDRKSVQLNNCSFGYIELELIKSHQYEPRTPLEETCYPMIPDKCPRRDPIAECPTCCCESSENVDFYNPDAPEPECKAPTAVYEMKFVFTRSAICHPDYFYSYLILAPQWSWPTAVSHNTKYKMWDACMDSVSVGVGQVSQVGLTSIIVQEFLTAGDNILDYAVGDILLSGNGTRSLNLTVDKDHQWVSAISMCAPTPDHMVGVADLGLCDGDKWKKKVKVCFELFSTAAASARVAGEMERNSIQANNCSFGHIELNLLELLTDSSAVSGHGSLHLAVAALSVFAAIALGME